MFENPTLDKDHFEDWRLGVKEDELTRLDDHQVAGHGLALSAPRERGTPQVHVLEHGSAVGSLLVRMMLLYDC